MREKWGNLSHSPTKSEIRGLNYIFFVGHALKSTAPTQQRDSLSHIRGGDKHGIKRVSEIAGIQD